jgi:hypothetical protein
VGILGLPHPLLWRVAAFLLHYIPFVGATGGIVAMTLVSLIHFDSVWYALLPPLAYVFRAMIEGSLATPIFLGRWLNPESNRNHIDFSYLVLSLGCGRHSAGCSDPGDLQNILRSNRTVETPGLIPRATLEVVSRAKPITWNGSAASFRRFKGDFLRYSTASYRETSLSFPKQKLYRSKPCENSSRLL